MDKFITFFFLPIIFIKLCYPLRKQCSIKRSRWFKLFVNIYNTEIKDLNLHKQYHIFKEKLYANQF